MFSCPHQGECIFQVGINPMKRKNIIIPVSTAIIVAFSVTITNSQSRYGEPYKKDVDEQKELDRIRLELAKQKVENLRREIIAKNKKFRVEVTEAIKHKIEDITGLKLPPDLQREARIQSSLGERMFMLFLKKLSEYEKKKRMQELEREKEEGRYEETKEKEAKEDKGEAAEKRIPDEKLPDLYTIADPNVKTFNWLKNRRMTPVRHQGLCGSCWAFTSLAVFESSYYIMNNRELDLSEQHLIDCAVDRYGRDAGSCNGGWYGKVFDYLTGKSATRESAAPYLGRTSTCRSVPRTQFRVVAWGYVKKNAGIPTVGEMKKALCKYGPIAATVKVTPAFQAYAGGIFDENARVWGPRDINHGIVIVGWDDDKEAYLIKNSWGAQWGENGYMWIEYGCNNIGYGAAWIAVVKEGL